MVKPDFKEKVYFQKMNIAYTSEFNVDLGIRRLVLTSLSHRIMRMEHFIGRVTFMQNGYFDLYMGNRSVGIPDGSRPNFTCALEKHYGNDAIRTLKTYAGIDAARNDITGFGFELSNIKLAIERAVKDAIT